MVQCTIVFHSLKKMTSQKVLRTSAVKDDTASEGGGGGRYITNTFATKRTYKIHTCNCASLMSKTVSWIGNSISIGYFCLGYIFYCKTKSCFTIWCVFSFCSDCCRIWRTELQWIRPQFKSSEEMKPKNTNGITIRKPEFKRFFSNSANFQFHETKMKIK